jgi:thiamine kinase-like enzyme
MAGVHAWRAEIRTLVDRAEALGQWLQATAAPLVLCHADIHTGNVLLDTANNLWIVDWDETMLAPKERDLMFVVGGIIGDYGERVFLMSDIGAESKRDALRGFMDLFRPGNIVALAFTSDSSEL